MKLAKSLLYTFIVVLLMGTFNSHQAFSQSDLVKYLNTGMDPNNIADSKADAAKLVNEYIKPVAVGASYGLNGGWFTTAKAHKTLGFDIGVYATPVFIPKNHDTFTPDNLGLKTIQTVKPGAPASTIMGPDQTVQYQLKSDPTKTFNGPAGLGLRDNIKVSGVVVPMLQLGVGIYKNTDLKIRYLPETKLSDTKVKVLGFGILHDVKQHIPGIRSLPFDLSFLAAFTDMKGKTNLSGEFKSPASDTRTQQAEYEFKSWLFQALISKKISILTVYGGIGYSATKSNSSIVGSYVVPLDQSNPNGLSTTFKDPVNLSYKNNSMRITAGARIVLGVIFINADYTLQEYSSATVGLGVAFR